MNTIIYLVVLACINRECVPLVQEIPTMEMCESIGKTLKRMGGDTRGLQWTCIEGAR